MSDVLIDAAIACGLKPGDRIRHEGGAEFMLARHHPGGWWELDSGRVFDEQLVDGEWFVVVSGVGEGTTDG